MDHIATIIDVSTGATVGQVVVVQDDLIDDPVLLRTVDPLPAGYGHLAASGRTVAEALDRLAEHVPNRTHDNYAVAVE